MSTQYRAKEAKINIRTVDGYNYRVCVSPKLDYWGVSDQEYVVEARARANTIIQSRYPIRCDCGTILERTVIRDYLVSDGEEITLQGKGLNKALTIGMYIAGVVLFVGVLAATAILFKL